MSFIDYDTKAPYDDTYHMHRIETHLASSRTTLILDEEVRAAARELAHQYGCSTSEAIRRAVVQQRDAVFGISNASRESRVRTLEVLFEQFQDNDAEAEVRRLKDEDEGF